MDSETAQTLGELERKLGELERELAAVGAANSNSRLIDEAAKPTSSPPPLAPPPPPAPPPKAPPGAEELLRFRERLEQTAAELTHDYDELLGRLSYAAVPASTVTPVGPTISFARGAPSLDIIDVDGLREAAVRALESDPARHDRIRHVGRLSEAARVDRRQARRRARARARDERLDAGRRVPVRAARGRGRRGDRRAPDVRPHAAVAAQARRAACTRWSCSRTGSTPTRSPACWRALPARSPKLAHIIPNFQNPAGYTLSPPSAERCLALAAEHGFVVFEDDPYVELRFSGEPLPTMLSIDPERVVYASSFSKTVCPGIRVGYLVGPRELIASDREARDEHLHLAEHGRAVDRVRVLRLGRDRALDRDGQAPRSPSAPTRSRGRCAASCRRPSSSRRRAATSCG